MNKEDNEKLYLLNELYIFEGTQGIDICYMIEDYDRKGIYRFYNVEDNKLVLKLKYVPNFTVYDVVKTLGLEIPVAVDREELLEYLCSIMINYSIHNKDFNKYVYKK